VRSKESEIQLLKKRYSEISLDVIIKGDQLKIIQKYNLQLVEENEKLFEEL